MPIPTIITGSSSGIGKSISELILNSNNNVLGIDICDSTISSKNYQHMKVDIASFNKLKDLPFLEIFSNYQGLVNAAGVTLKAGDENKFEVFDKTLAINLKAPYYFSEMFYASRNEPFLNSSIVNISSIGGKMGFPGNPSYCSSKGGIESLTRALAVDYYDKKVRVNSVRPGYTETPMNKISLSNSEEKEKRGKHSVMNRWGYPHEIADSIKFLLSNDSTFITGSCLTVDGGWTIKGFNN